MHFVHGSRSFSSWMCTKFSGSAPAAYSSFNSFGFLFSGSAPAAYSFNSFGFYSRVQEPRFRQQQLGQKSALQGSMRREKTPLIPYRDRSPRVSISPGMRDGVWGIQRSALVVISGSNVSGAEVSTSWVDALQLSLSRTSTDQVTCCIV